MTNDERRPIVQVTDCPSHEVTHKEGERLTWIKCGKVWSRPFVGVEVTGWWGPGCPWSRMSSYCLN